MYSRRVAVELLEEILHPAEAEVEAEVQPDDVRDDLGREAVAPIRRTVSAPGVVTALLSVRGAPRLPLAPHGERASHGAHNRQALLRR